MDLGMRGKSSYSVTRVGTSLRGVLSSTTCLLAVICLSTTLWVVVAGEEPKVDNTSLTFPMDCRPYHLRSMKFLLKNFNKCSRELKANSTTDKDYEENIGCAMKCTMRATGYSVDDLVTPGSMRISVKKLLPETLVEPVVQMLVTRCHQKYGEQLDPSEPQCRSYSEYAFCIQTTIADMIDSEFCIKYDKNGKPIPEKTR